MKGRRNSEDASDTRSIWVIENITEQKRAGLIQSITGGVQRMTAMLDEVRMSSCDSQLKVYK